LLPQQGFFTLLRLRLLLPVEMLPPYMPSAAEKADPVLYAANIRKLIVSGLCGDEAVCCVWL
jgi:hypothetical protein